jgi:hypothetical protein
VPFFTKRGSRCDRRGRATIIDPVRVALHFEAALPGTDMKAGMKLARATLFVVFTNDFIQAGRSCRRPKLPIPSRALEPRALSF